MPTYTRVLSILFLSGLSLIVCHSAHAVGTTTKVSVNPRGEQGNGNSEMPIISADGRYVAFKSFSFNLVPGDTNNDADIFVRDRLTNKVTRANIASDGTAVGGIHTFTLSADGRYVVFVTGKPNVTPDDNVFKEDVFVFDLKTGKTERISVDSDGVGGNDDSGGQFGSFPAISADGRFIAFVSEANNLVEGDKNKWADIFVRDRITHKTTRVSVASDGAEANGSSSFPAISGDGRFIAFRTSANNLVPGGGASRSDNVVVHDRISGKIELILKDSPIRETPAISSDGRFVAFGSKASNLVKGDTNNSSDIFVHDRITHQISRVSVGANGQQGVCQSKTCHTMFPTISADGRFVGFYGGKNIFVHDRITHKTQRINLKHDGTQDNSTVFFYSSISADGRHVAFQTAGSLVPEKSNFKQHIFLRDRILNNKLKADLALTRTPVLSIVSIGSTVIYKLTVTNNSSHPATEVNLTNTVLGNGQMLSMSPSQGRCTVGSISVCRLGTLPKGKKATITLKIKANAAGSLGNAANVTASPIDPKPSNNIVNWSATVQ